jgi:hypothetical protein
VVNPVCCHSVYTPWMITLYRATECCDILKLRSLPRQIFSTQIQSHARQQISVIIFWMWKFQSHTVCQKCYSNIRKILLPLKKLKRFNICLLHVCNQLGLRLLSRCKWDLRSSGMLRSTDWTTWPLKMGPVSCLETSVTTNLRCVASQKSEDLNLDG